MAAKSLIVVAIEKDHVYVNARDSRHCGQCAIRGGCGGYLLDNLLSSQHASLALPRQAVPVKLAAGDSVDLVMDDATLAKLSLCLFLIPLACLLLGTTLAVLWQLDEGWTVIAAVAALGAGTCCVHAILQNRQHLWLAGLFPVLTARGSRHED